MKQYTVDFNGASDSDQLYERVIVGMGLPNWCGRNPDAIWDLMTEYTACPAVVAVKGTEAFDGVLKEEIELIMNVFSDVVQWYRKIDMYLKISILD